MQNMVVFSCKKPQTLCTGAPRTHCTPHSLRPTLAAPRTHCTPHSRRRCTPHSLHPALTVPLHPALSALLHPALTAPLHPALTVPALTALLHPPYTHCTPHSLRCCTPIGKLTDKTKETHKATTTHIVHHVLLDEKSTWCLELCTMWNLRKSSKARNASGHSRTSRWRHVHAMSNRPVCKAEESKGGGHAHVKLGSCWNGHTSLL